MFTADRITALSPQECYELLRDNQHHVGRIAFDDGLPVILPVDYVLDVNHVVIRSAEGSKLDAALDGEMVAFQIDSVSSDKPPPAHAWSVLVRGRANVVTEPDEQRFLRLSQLDPSAGGLKPFFITIELDTVTGRRF